MQRVPLFRPVRFTGAIAAATLLTVALGCADPNTEASLQAVDPALRVRASADAAARGEQEAIPDLIAGLDSDDPAVRMLSSAALRRLAGEDMGYHFADRESKRREAADRWQAWWEAERASRSTTPMGRVGPQQGASIR